MDQHSIVVAGDSENRLSPDDLLQKRFTPLNLKQCDFKPTATPMVQKSASAAGRVFSDVTLVLKDGQPLAAHGVILLVTRAFSKDILNQNRHNKPLIYTSSPLQVLKHISCNKGYILCSLSNNSIQHYLCSRTYHIQGSQTLAMYGTNSCVSLW